MKPVYKKRRIAPMAVATVSEAALASTYNKPASQAQVRRLQREVSALKKDAETKIFDTALSFNFDATGEVPATGQLCLIPQGSTDATRNGRKCVIKSIQIRGAAGMVPAAAVTSSSTAHLYIIWDRQCNGAAAAVLDVFSSTNLAYAFRDAATWNRFTILKHWKHTFTPTAGVSGAYNNVQCAVEIYRKVNIPLEFTSTTGAITEINSNNIFLMAGTEGASDDTIQFAGACRLTFRDI